ncbi:MAG: hypothetical protein PHG66_04925 [Candidatus Colwellbacteria bacterium]|nr:hypothetical protein [Candidatus Colwellbacteria bacterium]
MSASKKIDIDIEEEKSVKTVLIDEGNINEMITAWLGYKPVEKNTVQAPVKIEKTWFYKGGGRWGPHTHTACNKDNALHKHLTVGYEIYQNDTTKFLYKIVTGINEHRYENWTIDYEQMVLKSSTYEDGDIDGLYIIRYDDEKKYDIKWNDKFNKYIKTTFNNIEKSLMFPIDKKTPYTTTVVDMESDEFKIIRKLITEHSNPLGTKKIVIKKVKSVIHPKIARMYAFEKEIMNNDREGLLFHTSKGAEDIVLGGGLDMRYPQSDVCGSAIYVTDSVDACHTNISQNGGPLTFYIVRCLLGNSEELKKSKRMLKPSATFNSVQYQEIHPHGEMFSKTNTFCLYSNSQTFITHVVNYDVVVSDCK